MSTMIVSNFLHLDFLNVRDNGCGKVAVRSHESNWGPAPHGAKCAQIGSKPQLLS